MRNRILLARVLVGTSLICGVVGLVAGLAERPLKLGVTGWLLGGTLLAILALVAVADEYFSSRSNR